MQNKKKIGIIIVLILSVLWLQSGTYAKYVLTREFDVTATAAPFYFGAEQVSSTITFPRTATSTDFDIILTKQTDVKLVIKNNDGTNYNDFETTYEVAVVDSPKYILEGETVTKTIAGGEKKDETINLKLNIQDLTNPSKTVKIRVTPIKPYRGNSIEFTFNVVQEGAIQTIEELLDLSLAVRNQSRKGIASSSVISQRFMLTRDLDFESDSSYENAYRTDYGDVNGNDIIASNLKAELTSDTGFLPIGISSYKFTGCFNGGGHSLSNLQIHKSKQTNIGLFGWTQGATIKNLEIINGHVNNENQTAGMVVGKVTGGLLENITVSGRLVESKDLLHEDQDTYTGGIAGYVEQGATVRNCHNYASVNTTFSGDSATYSGPAGGIAAWMSTSLIEDCTNHGTITGQSYVGGIVGFSGMQDATNDQGSGTVTRCINYGTVTTYVPKGASAGGLHIGGIAGYNKVTGYVEYSKNYGAVSGRKNIGGIVGHAAGIVRYCENHTTQISGDSAVDRIMGFGAGKTNAGSVGNQSFDS